jgi:hypothetical protein
MSTSSYTRRAAAAALISAAAWSQFAAPFPRQGDLLVVDTSPDVVYRLQDMNLDGDYDDLGEIVPFFTSGGGTGVVSTLISGIAVGPDGSVFVCDTSADHVLRLVDLNLDGDADDPGEAVVFFGSSGTAFPNASGVAVPAMLGIAVSRFGEVYAVNSGSSAAPNDFVLKLFDLNADGDAQDPGEAVVYRTISTSSTGGVSVPTAVAVGPDDAVYYCESGSQTTLRGVRRLVDLNLDGDADDVGEETLYFQPPAAVVASNVAFYGLSFEAFGRVYLSDHSADVVYFGVDSDASLSIDALEQTTYFTAPAPSLMWNVAVAFDPFGAPSLLAIEDQTPEQIRRLVDLDFDGAANGSGEATTAYHELSATVNFTSPRCMAFMKGPYLQASPSPATLGSTLTLAASGGRGEAFAIFAGIPLPAPFLLPPFGALAMDPTPGTFFELVPTLLLPPSGEASFPIAIPNFPPLLTMTVVVQAVGGVPSRLLFSNASTVGFQ